MSIDPRPPSCTIDGETRKMKAFREVTLTTRRLDDYGIVETLKAFADASPHWSFMEKESTEYTHRVGTPGCMIILSTRNTGGYPAVGIVKRKDGEYYVANVVPGIPGALSMAQYNEIADRFVADFRIFLRESGAPLLISITRGELELEKIITSAKAREYFHRYLLLYPRSRHAADVERLDAFICALSKYSRKAIPFDRFERYLREDLSWDEQDARWCRERVETGCEILRVNKRF